MKSKGRNSLATDSDCNRTQQGNEVSPTRMLKLRLLWLLWKEDVLFILHEKRKKKKIPRNKVSARQQPASDQFLDRRGGEGMGEEGATLISVYSGGKIAPPNYPSFPLPPRYSGEVAPVKNVKYLSLGMENVCDVMRGYLRTSPVEAWGPRVCV